MSFSVNITFAKHINVCVCIEVHWNKLASMCIYTNSQVYVYINEDKHMSVKIHSPHENLKA